MCTCTKNTRGANRADKQLLPSAAGAAGTGGREIAVGTAAGSVGARMRASAWSMSAAAAISAGTAKHTKPRYFGSGKCVRVYWFQDRDLFSCLSDA
jgi:hypothetical protein